MRPNYGIDAPNVIRNLLLAGTAFLVTALLFPRVHIGNSAAADPGGAQGRGCDAGSCAGLEGKRPQLAVESK
jgi:hypothetical protein